MSSMSSWSRNNIDLISCAFRFFRDVSCISYNDCVWRPMCVSLSRGRAREKEREREIYIYTSSFNLWVLSICWAFSSKTSLRAEKTYKYNGLHSYSSKNNWRAFQFNIDFVCPRCLHYIIMIPLWLRCLRRPLTKDAFAQAWFWQSWEFHQGYGTMVKIQCVFMFVLIMDNKCVYDKHILYRVQCVYMIYTFW